MKKLLPLWLVMSSFFANAQKSVPPVEVLQFGLKADFQRLRVSLQSNKATASGYSFTAGDTGKILVIKGARRYADYSNMPLALNAVITEVKNSVATISSPHLQQAVDVQDADAFLATNNYDAIKKAIDYCRANSKQKLLLNYTGTAYVSPFLSEKFLNSGKTDVGVRSLFSINGSMEIAGLGKEKTILKTGSEDIVFVNPADKLNFLVFYLYANPDGPVENKTFRNFSIEGSDRATTAVGNGNGVFQTCYADNQVMKILVENVDIRSRYGMDNGFSTSRGGRWNTNGTVKDFCEYTIRNCNWEVNNPLSVYSQIPDNVTDALYGAKKVYVQNTIFNGGGTPIVRKYLNKASTANGLITMSEPGFSFYDFGSYREDKNRQPVITLEEAVETTIKSLKTDIGVNRNVELNAPLPLTKGYLDVYVYDKNGVETAWIQRSHTETDSTMLYVVTFEPGSKFQPGNRIRVVYRKTQCQVTDIYTPTSARIDWPDGTPQTFNNVTAIVNDDGRAAEGHTMYIHPNVSCSFKNLTIKNALKLALHHYSGNGVKGSRLFFELDSVVVEPTDKYLVERGPGWRAPFEFTMENCNPPQPIHLKNSNLGFYQMSAWMDVHNTRLWGGQCGGGTFDHCTGNIDVVSTYPTVITNCQLEGYSGFRPDVADKLTVKISNSGFGWLAVGAVHSLSISNSKIENYIVGPKVKPYEQQRIKLEKVTVTNKQ